MWEKRLGQHHSLNRVTHTTSQKHTEEDEEKMASNKYDVPHTDPKVYDEYQAKWSSLPTDEASWIQRASDVAVVLAKDAGARESANKSPQAEVALLKHSGLLKALGPKKYGGGEQPWSVAYKLIREVAKGDG